ncbi:hypothetical protein BOTCAL_0275g00110 [Botryotinia calthae]|uniref:Uncharacterized protein n=1 Tax=Botryotinia calthae TaxID=38488 RepID=A0A4Y8CYB4_9HELO|nr:hypothetical protein BOTCAL_0275g00110 [Botryotinia calthae]
MIAIANSERVFWPKTFREGCDDTIIEVYTLHRLPADPNRLKNIRDILTLIPINPTHGFPPLYIPRGYNSLFDAHLAVDRTLYIRILDEIT